MTEVKTTQLIRAMDKAVSLGLFPETAKGDDYLNNYEAMGKILQAAMLPKEETPMDDRTVLLETCIIGMQVAVSALHKELNAARIIAPHQVDSIEAIAWRLEQGDDNGGLAREVLAKFLRGLVKNNG